MLKLVNFYRFQQLIMHFLLAASLLLYKYLNLSKILCLCFKPCGIGLWFIFMLLFNFCFGTIGTIGTINHTDIQKKARHEISLMSSKKEICVRRLFLETRYKFFGALTRIPNICNLNTLLRFSIDDFCQMTN